MKGLRTDSELRTHLYNDVDMRNWTTVTFCITFCVGKHQITYVGNESHLPFYTIVRDVPQMLRLRSKYRELSSESPLLYSLSVAEDFEAHFCKFGPSNDPRGKNQVVLNQVIWLAIIHD